MPRIAASSSIDEMIQSAVSSVMASVAPRIAKVIADSAAQRLEQELQVRGPSRVAGGRASRRRTADLTRWVADNRARRVPKFVIEMTGGLDTKKKVVAKYGPNATFEQGKPLPKPAK